MAQIITPQQIKDISTPTDNIDPIYFENSIEYWQDAVLKPLMTTALYNDFIANIGGLSVDYQFILDNFIKYAESYGVAFTAQKKDLIIQTDNKGMMQNRSDYSNSSSNVKAALKEYKERELHYLQQLGCYLLDNLDKFPLLDLDVEEPYLGLDTRDFIIN